MYSSSVYSCHLLLISSASVSSTLFLSFFVLIFAWNILLVSPIFLKSYLVFPTLLFPIFLFIVHLRRLLLSPCYSLKLCIHMGIFFPFLLGLPVLFSTICKAASDNHFDFLFLWDGFGHHPLYNIMRVEPYRP